MPTPSRVERMLAYDRAIEYARLTGADHGKAAASWYFDGNTDRATYARVLQGIEDGDPAVLDTLPAPDLSGQWADGLTGPQLVADAVSEALYAGDLITADGSDDWADAWFSDLCDAYEIAYNDAAQDEIARMARYQTGEDDAR